MQDKHWAFSKSILHIIPGKISVDKMKILVFCSTIDFMHRLGTTPFWWQLLKALHESGCEIIVTPYLGRPIESPWWSVYPNPFSLVSRAFNRMLDSTGRRSIGRYGFLSYLSMPIIKSVVRPRWEKNILEILDTEGDVDILLVLGVPLNQIVGIPSKAKLRSKLKVVYFDGDLPTSLPDYAKNNAFKFDFYPGADLGEYDLFLSSSLGSLPILKSMGARNPQVMYYGVDPDVYTHIKTKKEHDIFYYGHWSNTKESRMDYMINKPAQALADNIFLVGGKGYGSQYK